MTPGTTANTLIMGSVLNFNGSGAAMALVAEDAICWLCSSLASSFNTGGNSMQEALLMMYDSDSLWRCYRVQSYVGARVIVDEIYGWCWHNFHRAQCSRLELRIGSGTTLMSGHRVNYREYS